MCISSQVPFTVFLAVNRSSIRSIRLLHAGGGSRGGLLKVEDQKSRRMRFKSPPLSTLPQSCRRNPAGGQLDIEMGDANRLELVRVFRRLNRRSNSPVAGDVADVYRRRTSPFFRVVHNTPLRTVLARKNRRKGILGTSSPNSGSYEISREKPGNMGI